MSNDLVPITTKISTGKEPSVIWVDQPRFARRHSLVYVQDQLMPNGDRHFYWVERSWEYDDKLNIVNVQHKKISDAQVIPKKGILDSDWLPYMIGIPAGFILALFLNLAMNLIFN